MGSPCLWWVPARHSAFCVNWHCGLAVEASTAKLKRDARGAKDWLNMRVTARRAIDHGESHGPKAVQNPESVTEMGKRSG